jgi:hypothetical protein
VAEPLPEALPPETTHDPVDDTDQQIARRNMEWGWWLFGLFCLLFAGTVGIAFVYLWLS